MTRTLSVERLYFLGDYKNLKIGNSIDVSDEIASDPTKIQLVFRQLGTECDLAYQDYKDLNEEIKNKTNADERSTSIRELLQQERDRIAQELAQD